MDHVLQHCGSAGHCGAGAVRDIAAVHVALAAQAVNAVRTERLPDAPQSALAAAVAAGFHALNANKGVEATARAASDALCAGVCVNAAKSVKIAKSFANGLKKAVQNLEKMALSNCTTGSGASSAPVLRELVRLGLRASEQKIPFPVRVCECNAKDTRVCPNFSLLPHRDARFGAAAAAAELVDLHPYARVPGARFDAGPAGPALAQVDRDEAQRNADHAHWSARSDAADFAARAMAPMFAQLGLSWVQRRHLLMARRAALPEAVAEHCTSEPDAPLVDQLREAAAALTATLSAQGERDARYDRESATAVATYFGLPTEHLSDETWYSAADDDARDPTETKAGIASVATVLSGESHWALKHPAIRASLLKPQRSSVADVEGADFESNDDELGYTGSRALRAVVDCLPRLFSVYSALLGPATTMLLHADDGEETCIDIKENIGNASVTPFHALADSPATAESTRAAAARAVRQMLCFRAMSAMTAVKLGTDMLDTLLTTRHKYTQLLPVEQAIVNLSLSLARAARPATMPVRALPVPLYASFLCEVAGRPPLQCEDDYDALAELALQLSTCPFSGRLHDDDGDDAGKSAAAKKTDDMHNVDAKEFGFGSSDPIVRAREAAEAMNEPLVRAAGRRMTRGHARIFARLLMSGVKAGAVSLRAVETCPPLITAAVGATLGDAVETVGCGPVLLKELLSAVRQAMENEQ